MGECVQTSGGGQMLRQRIGKFGIANGQGGSGQAYLFGAGFGIGDNGVNGVLTSRTGSGRNADQRGGFVVLPASVVL